MKRGMIAGLVAGLMVVAWAAQAGDADASLYVGAKSCKMCHKSAAKGDQAGKWEAGPHSKAYEMLASDEAKAAGAKVGVDNPQTSPKCLKCHSTAYNWTEEKQTDAIPVEEGVSCESCHGPGKNYKSASTMKDKAASVAAGMVESPKTQCTKCHNEESPSWDPTRYGTTGFDVEKAYEKINHSNPAK